MAIVGLSEFTFGFGFLFEQTSKSWGNLRVAPVLPSLIQEADDAWDAKLPVFGTDFYYQFKLSDYLVRRNSIFHKDGTYTSPYYRLALHRRDNNRQHHRLWEHAQSNANTFYVAPEFETIDDFNTAFLARNLAGNSRVIPVSACDDCNDDDQHYITFQQGSQAWIQHSEPRRKTLSYQGRAMGDLYRESRQTWRSIDEDFAEAALRRTTSAIKRTFARHRGKDIEAAESASALLEVANVDRNRVAMLRRTAEILAIFVGVTMVIVGEGLD